MLLTRSLRALRHRRFAAVWTGVFCSNVGTWMETVAVGILVTTQTGEAQWTGLAGAAAFLPSAVLGPVGGALSDRFARHRVLMTTSAVQALFAACLTALAASGEAKPWIVVLIVLASGSANALGMPSYQSLAPELVPREDLPGAMALSGMQWNLGRVIGPILATVAIGIGGYELAFAINTVSFAAVILAVAPLALSRPHPETVEPILHAIRTGLRYVSRERGMRAGLAYTVLVSLLVAPVQALMPAVALKLFHDEQGGTAALVSGLGLGAVGVAILFGGLVAHFGHRRVLLVAVHAFPLAALGYALAPSLEVATVMAMALGACMLGTFMSIFVIAQLRTPPELRGRVMSIVWVVWGVGFPIGAVIQGAIADAVGLRETMATGALALLVALVALRLARPGFDDELRDPEAVDHAPVADAALAG